MQRIVRNESMKNIQEVPRTIVLGQEAVNIEDDQVAVAKRTAVPPKRVLGSNLSALNGFKELRRDIKLRYKTEDFIGEVKKVLELFDLESKKYDHKVILFICQMAEHYFISEPKMGKIKESAVIQSCKLLYDDNEALVKSIIELVLPQVAKSNVIRRAESKVKKFFLVSIKVLFGISLM